MHIEAGLRSDVIDMPEEQNRYISDYLSDFLIAPTNIAFNNLKSKKKKKKFLNLVMSCLIQFYFYKKTHK